MYYFHFCHGHIIVRDQIGLELEDRTAAVHEAQSAIALLLGENVDEPKFPHLQSIRIEDAFGKVLEVLPLSRGRVEPEAHPILRRDSRRA